MMMLYYSA